MLYETYTEIVTAVRDELNRSDITDAQIQTFIRITERRVYRELRIPPMEAKDALPILPASPAEADSTERFSPPGRWLETITLTTESGTPVEFVTQQLFRNLTKGAGGRSIYFTREQDVFLLWPAAGGDTVQMYYYQEPLPGDAETNNTPEIYQYVGEGVFFGAVSEGWRFVREPEKHMYYKEQFAEVLGQLAMQYKQSDISGSTLITKNPYQ